MILLVDDTSENLFSLKSLLQLHRYEVDTASSGEEALKKILKNDYMLIILDVQMPGMDGYEVAEAVTGYSKTKNIPIIFLSAVAIDKRFVTRGYESGGVDYVTKPFDPDLLLLKIQTFARLHQQARELNDIKASLEQKVEARTEALREANKELEQRNAELQQYSYIASHDLQEPLRKIITFSDILTERFNARPEALEYIRKIAASSHRMKNLINDLLLHSTLSMALQFARSSLNEIVADAVADLEILITEKGAQLTVADLPAIDVIPDQMRQVFQNLISNALKFSKKEERPSIKIWSERTAEKHFESPIVPHGAFCRVAISDNGIGFNERYLDKIFTIFQRLHNRSEYDGTGIGLSIVKKIIEKHNGIVTARSQVAEGSTFVFVLPVRQEPAAEPEGGTMGF